MQKLFYIVFVVIGTQLNIFAQISFPLERGNKWYYQAGSTDYAQFGITYEVTREFGNGYKEILVKNYYRDSTVTRIENWGFIEEKLYINHFPGMVVPLIYFDSSIKKDSCRNYTSTSYCYKILFTQMFGVEDTAQEFEYHSHNHIESYNETTIVLPGVGITSTKRSGIKSGGIFWNDSTQLIGMLKSGELIGNKNFTILADENKKGNLPIVFSLFQNYPNPFNPTTTISYQIPQAEFVKLKVYDLLGREVALLVNEEKPAGSYEIEFDGSNLTSGVYFYRLEGGGDIETKKLLLLK